VVARVSKTEDEFVDPASLKLDLRNPRAGSETFTTEEQAIKHLISTADIDEIVISIQSVGWIDFEPLIVERSTRTALEGNRRLTALRLLSDPDLCKRVEYTLPASEKVATLPAQVRVRWVDDRKEARSFIAFKHINGPAKWDAFAKARYAREWLVENGASIDDVSRAVGDNNNTVLRLVNGLTVLEQAIAEGFDRADITARQFNFSHLYTALTRPSIRKYIGLPEEVGSLLAPRPVPEANLENLANLMGWLFGQAKQKREHVIKSQNPDLGKLVRVIGEPRAMAVLERDKSLRSAFDEVEPPSTRFADSLKETALSAERSLGLITHYAPSEQPGLLDTVQKLAQSVRLIRDEMKKKSAQDDDL
jgi:hypothetical protein